ncbi:hypothetical protein HKX48_003956 [Thoreauomyces humboldtii]|nr:hypothetical protein HKX48_003956 [Thoreauomyces humboldtii]
MSPLSIRINGIGKAYPDTVFAKEEYLELLVARVKPCRNLAKLIAVVKASQIETRHAVIPIGHEMLSRPVVPTIKELNDIFSIEAPKYAKLAAERAIEDWGGHVAGITHVVTATVTGVMNPGLDYHLQQSLKLSPTVERYNLSGVGCAGGLATLRLATNLAKAHGPGARILVCCVELCTLYAAQRFFQCTDDAPLDVAAALFGDGASALVVEGVADGTIPTSGSTGRTTPPSEDVEGDLGESAGDHLFEIVDHVVSTHTSSVDDLGFRLENDGYQILLTRNVPILAAETLPPLVQTLFSRLPASPSSSSASSPAPFISASSIPFLIHPGGPAVLQVLEKCMGLNPWQTKSSWQVMSKRGNTSSATIFAVLDAFRDEASSKDGPAAALGKDNPDGYAMAAAFGPGVTTECVLLKAGPRIGAGVRGRTEA